MTGEYGAVSLRTEEDWYRVEKVFATLIAGAYN
jgi:hypothetical protein